MDKLTVVNNALINTGNTPINELEDGSDEWRAANASFDRSLEALIAEHKWPFQTGFEPLSLLGESSHPRFDYAFAYPADAWHLRSVYRTSVFITGGQTVPKGYVINYEVADHQIHADYDSDLVAYIVRQPIHYDGDPNWHPLATEVLTQMVEVGCLRALNEDFDEADKREQRAMVKLLSAQTRVDQQSAPPRGFVSSIAAARRIRRGGGSR